MLLFLIEVGWVGAGRSATLRLAVIWVVELAVLITAFACLGHSVRATRQAWPRVRVRAEAASHATPVAADRREDGADHHVLRFGILDPAAPDLCARGMHQRPGHCELP